MSEELVRKATEMRNAIDMIEGALMGLGDFTELPDLFEGTAEHVNLAPKMTVGEMRRVCTALAECTRIINSEEFAPDELRRHAQRARDEESIKLADEMQSLGYPEFGDCLSLKAYNLILKALRASSVPATLTSADGGKP